MIDVASIPLLPLDIALELLPPQSLSRVRRALQFWAANGADLEKLAQFLESVNIAAGQARISPGGSAANVLRAAQKWGCNTALAGVLGEDSAGDSIRSPDIAAGLDLSLVQRQMGRATPIYLMLVRAGAVETAALIPRSQRVLSVFQSDQAVWSRCAAQLQTLAPRVLHVNRANQKLLALVEQLPPETRI